MRKKLIAVGMITVLALTSTGCGSKNYTLTTEQNDRVASYIASAMLEHSYEYEWQYRKAKSGLSGNTSSSANSGNVQNSNSSSTSTSTTDSQNISTDTQSADPLKALAQKMGAPDADVSFQTYTVGDRYPTGEYVICVPAEAGCKVVAVEFTVKNGTGSPITLDTSSNSVVLKLTLDGDSVAQAETILKNDISKLKNVNVESGDTYTAVALFQVKKEKADNLSKLSVGIYAGGGSLGNVQIK